MKKILFFLLIGCISTAFANNSLDTVLGFKRIGNVAISPDGQQTVYTVSQIISTPNGKARDYYLFLKDKSGKTKQLFKGQYVSQPVWSSNGKWLAYLQKRDKKQEIILFDLTTKDVKTLISMIDRNIASFKFSPNGKLLAFVADDEGKKISSH